MAKGIASKNSLKALAHPIEQFLAAWGAREKIGATRSGDGTTRLPAPYELAALRGEGILRERFFSAFMKKLPVQLDAAQQIAAWESLVQEGGLVTAWVQRLGIAKALRREALLPLEAHSEARKLYCLLIDALSAQEPQLLAWAVEGYFWHCWKQQFPELAHIKPKEQNTDVQVQRERLLRMIRKKHGNTAQIKESFQQTDSDVRFSLLWRAGFNSPWQALMPETTRPRLKTARVWAYQEAASHISRLAPQ